MVVGLFGQRLKVGLPNLATNGLNKKSTDMKEEFNLLRYTIELTYIKKLNELKWWQFTKRKEVNKWRESHLQKC